MFLKGIRFLTQRNYGASNSINGFPKETVTAMMMPHKATKAKVHAPDSDVDLNSTHQFIIYNKDLQFIL